MILNQIVVIKVTMIYEIFNNFLYKNYNND